MLHGAWNLQRGHRKEIFRTSCLDPCGTLAVFGSLIWLLQGCCSTWLRPLFRLCRARHAGPVFDGRGWAIDVRLLNVNSAVSDPNIEPQML